MIQQEELTVEMMLREREREMDLDLLSGKDGLSNPIRTAELNRPGLAFAGYREVFSFDRVQIVGNTEMSYLLSLAADDLRKCLDATFGFKIPVVIVTNAAQPPADMLEITDRAAIPPHPFEPSYDPPGQPRHPLSRTLFRPDHQPPRRSFGRLRHGCAHPRRERRGQE